MKLKRYAPFAADTTLMVELLAAIPGAQGGADEWRGILRRARCRRVVVDGIQA